MNLQITAGKVVAELTGTELTGTELTGTMSQKIWIPFEGDKCALNGIE